MRYSEAMLELAILGLLKEQDLHGYELKKRLGETLGVSSGVSFGSLYPALGRLQKGGALRAVDQAADGAGGSMPGLQIPLTGSLGGELAAWRARAAGPLGAVRKGTARSARSRKVYRITTRGEALFEELLAAEQAGGDDSRTFSVRLAFARYLSAEARLGMLERRRAHLLDRLSRAGTASRTGRRIDGYVRSLMDHDRESAEHDLSWVERLIAGESDPATSLVSLEPPASPAPPRTPVPAAASPARRREVAAPSLSGFGPRRDDSGAPRTNQEEDIR
jgi:DNA-binding PadR family transcriptional regulator